MAPSAVIISIDERFERASFSMCTQLSLYDLFESGSGDCIYKCHKFYCQATSTRWIWQFRHTINVCQSIRAIQACDNKWIQGEAYQTYMAKLCKFETTLCYIYCQTDIRTYVTSPCMLQCGRIAPLGTNEGLINWLNCLRKPISYTELPQSTKQASERSVEAVDARRIGLAHALSAPAVCTCRS